MRKCIVDIREIAKNTGMAEHKIKRIKQHLFYDDTHILDKGIGRFAPDAEIASAWDRLIKGDFIPNDIKLLEHEYFESKIEKIFKLNYRKAHELTEDSSRVWHYPTLEELS
ncbi:hypothetical protein GF322_00470 [Candidatus Dependentiae bacterium]|nr:hypothetical protein [Candidatus Dependentiae bacterium]